MADLNSWSVTGRLTRNAEQKTTSTGTRLVVFNISNNTGWGDYKKTLYITVNVWGKQGNNLIEYLLQGRLVAITGSVELQEWVSTQDGSPQKKLVINASSVILLHDGGKEKQLQQESSQDEIVF